MAPDRIRVAAGVHYGPILYHFRDKARYWSKIATIPHVRLTSPLGGPCRSIAAIFATEKLEWCGYRR